LTAADELRTAVEGALLELHQRERQAHLTGDAELLASGVAEVLIDSSRGGIQRLSRDEFRDRFADYFGRVRYSRWDDIEAPVVSVSADGSQAWMAIHIEADLATLDGEAGVSRAAGSRPTRNARTAGSWSASDHLLRISTRRF
jgi:hypothetical protein